MTPDNPHISIPPPRKIPRMDVISEITIDWRDWQDVETAIQELGKLLKPHGVDIRFKKQVASRASDFFTFEATSLQ